MEQKIDNTPKRFIKQNDFIETELLEREILKYANLKLDTELEVFDVTIPHPSK